MKNILIITPLYKIINRDDLFKDTQAIYDLNSYNKKDNIYVINSYIHGLSDIVKLFNNKYLKYKRVGFDYQIDNIKVTLIERQNLLPNKINGRKLDSKRHINIIEKKLLDNKFIPDRVVVHIPSTTMFFVKKMNFNCKKIAILHMTDVKYLKSDSNEFISYLNNYFDAIYCRSKNIYNIFKKYNLNNLKSDIIYSGIDNNYVKKDNKKFNNKCVNILYAGKLIERKKLDLLIECLSNINNYNWHLNVIGVGPCYKKYKDLVNKLKLNDKVKFLGQLSKEKVLDYMNNSDIFCMPSINETFGLVYLEAMAKGCITIGTINEGIDGIIKDNYNGFLVNAKKDDLLDKLNYILNLDEKRKNSISKEAINTAIKFSAKKISEDYFEIINR